MFVNNILFLHARVNRPVGPDGTAKYGFMKMAKTSFTVVLRDTIRSGTPLPPYTVLSPCLQLWTFVCYGIQKVRVVLAVLFPCAQSESRRSRLQFVGGSTHLPSYRA